VSAAEFLRQQQSLRESDFCLFGSGDGAAAALCAAAIDPAEFSAMVLSGGRLTAALTQVSRNSVPTLFIVGSEDHIAAKTTHMAYGASSGKKALVVLKGAGHLLREPGALEDVAEKSLAWIEESAPCRR